MKKLTLYLMTFIYLLVGCQSAKEVRNQDSFKLIESKFRQIPDDQKLAIYWYWLSGNISEEGVVKDLHAMKRAGINRAFIGHIQAGQEKEDAVKMFSEEWWRVMHRALKTASELDIEIGIFNSPGWSQSGGPWVTPDRSMRYLSSTQVFVTGPLEYNQLMPIKGDDAQDVKVIAYPTIKQNSHFEVIRSAENPKIIDFKSENSAVVRSIVIQTGEKRVYTHAELFVKGEKGYDSLCDIDVNRSNFQLNVGFDPFAPIVISIADISAKEFRLVVDGDASDLVDVNLSDIPYVERYPEKSMAKMFQTPLPMWADYLWPEQPEVGSEDMIVAADQVIDITEYMDSDGRLKWSVPEGDWTIMRTAMVTTGVKNQPASPEGEGLEIDKMSKEHVKYHFDSYIGKIMERIPAEDRTSFRVVVQDSYETGGMNWTDTIIEDFKEAYGYSPIEYIPVLQGVVVGSRDLSDRFLWDLRRLIADKIAYDYVAGLRKVSNEHGLTTWLENYGHWGFPGEFLQYGGQSDEISGEFWSEGTLGDIENRAASSCAHTYGKQLVWAESYTCGGADFHRYPAYIKARGDRFFTEGINSTLLHLFVHQPDDNAPGVRAPWGNIFNRHNTWFSQIDLFIKYLKRCNYMLQQGQYIADVAYFIGEDTPKMTGVCDPELPLGYSFDYINAEILLTAAYVEDNKLKLASGMEYSVLVLPKSSSMRPELLAKIESFVSQGLTILGSAPTHSPSLENFPVADEQVQSIAHKLWSGDLSSGASYGKGVVYDNVSLSSIFDKHGVVPDFMSEAEDSLLFIHRKTDEGDIYFISNQTDKVVESIPQFRVKGKQPELWDPQTSIIRTLNSYEELESAIAVPMTLQPYESVFVIFRDSDREAMDSSNYPQGELLVSMSNPWMVKFQEASGAPEYSVEFKELVDWKDHSDKRVKYFSGSATYNAIFNYCCPIKT